MPTGRMAGRPPDESAEVGPAILNSTEILL